MGDGKRTQTMMKLGDWGSVLLARVNHFFKNESHCDLTIRLCSSETVKMHRVILHACTDYFDTILNPETTSLDLDESFPADIMVLIIKFMYTGQVNNLNDEIFEELHKMASILRIQILVDHLDAAKKQGSNLIETRSSSPMALPAEVLRPVVTNENPSPKRVQVWTRNAVPIIAAKKHKPCNVPLVLSSNTMIRFVLTKPIPTRFECQNVPCDDFPVTVVGDALSYMSYENDIPLLQPLNLEETISAEQSVRPSPVKRPREGSDLTNMKEFGRQQKIRNELMMEEDEEDVDDPGESPQTEISPKPILKSVQRVEQDTPKRVRFQEESQETKIEDQTYIPIATIAQPENKVEKIEYAGSGELLVTSQSGKADTSKRVQYSILPASGSDLSSEPNANAHSVDNPAKIVSEVLKKYPDLVTGRRKNIKLKVMTNNSTSETTPSYIYIKDAGAPKVDYSHELNPEVQGPMTCTPCGTENTPLHFSAYGDFRKHIVNVHHVKISPKICEHCGTRVTHMNQMPYHLYVKHKIKPPQPDLYPKCEQCPHISFSQALLTRHVELVHKSGPLVCKTCNVSFKSHQLYRSHVCHPVPPDRRYRCPYCEQVFNQRNSLQEHIVSEHWKTDEKKEKDRTEIEEVEIEENESSSPQPDETIIQDQPMEDASNASLEETPDENPPELVNEQVESSADDIEITEETQEIVEVAEEDVTEEIQPLQTEELEKPVEAEEMEGMEKSVEIFDPPDQTESFEASEEAPVQEYCVDQVENQEVYDTETESHELEVSYEGKADEVDGEQAKSELNESFSSENVNDEAYEAMEIDEAVRTEEMTTDTEEVPIEAESEETEVVPEEQQETENRQIQGDHDYAPYNSMVMFQPNMVLQPRVMLVTHPIAHPLQVFMPAPNIMTDQMVLPYPQCTQVQMVNNVVPTTAQVVTTNVPTDCVQVVRERKVEPETLANDWDESSQSEPTAQSVLPPGVGPSRAEFF